jgi:hypothetical protein
MYSCGGICASGRRRYFSFSENVLESCSMLMQLRAGGQTDPETHSISDLAIVA